MARNYASALLTIPQENMESAHLERPIHICDGSILSMTLVKEGAYLLHPPVF